MARYSGRTFWYIITKQYGKIVVWHKSEWLTETQANQAGFKALKGQMFQCIGKPWHDVARMTQEAKAMHLEEKSDLEGAMRRAAHDPEKMKMDVVHNYSSASTGKEDEI